MKLVCAFVLLSAVSFVAGNRVSIAKPDNPDYTCTYSWGGNNYDAGPLTRSLDYQFAVAATTFWTNVCRPTVTQVCGVTSSMCQQWDPNNVNGHASLGNANTAVFQPTKTGGQGFIIQFTGGDVPPGQNTARSMEIDFTCDPTQNPGTPTYVIEQPALHYNFAWSSVYACPVGSTTATSTTFTTTGPTTGPQPPTPPPPPPSPIECPGKQAYLTWDAGVVYIWSLVEYNIEVGWVCDNNCSETYVAADGVCKAACDTKPYCGRVLNATFSPCFTTSC